ncbi:MAG: copper amine oxidase N-terminal domain-containing protein [Evtepia sp.]
MKKKVSAFLLVLVMLATNVFAIDLYIDGNKLELDVPPVIVNGRTLVPLRAVSEFMGAGVVWNGETRAVSILKDGTEVYLMLGNTTAYVNGLEKKMDVPASVIGDRTMVPVRFVSDALNTNVKWDAASQSVRIDTTIPPDPVPTPVPTPAPAPQPTPAPPTTPSPTTQDQNRIIYITKSGKKYHYDSTCNGGTYFESTLSAALKKGLTPCQKCVH